VLRPGGRLAFSVWAAREQNPWLTVPVEAMLELGLMEPARPRPDDPLEGRTLESVARALELAGFHESSIRAMAAGYRFADADELWTFVSELRGEVALAIEALGEEDRGRVREAVEARAGRTDDGGYELAGTSLNVLAS
jgi:hypothetical protein